MKKRIVLMVVLAMTAGMTLQAAVYNWTGGVDSDFYNELNWDLDGSPGTNPAADTINPEVDINHDLVITSGTAIIDAGSFAAEPYLGPGVGSLTMTGGVLDFIGSAGANGLAASVDGVDDWDNCAVLMGGDSLAQLQFVLDLDMTLTGSSTLELFGGGNPINRSVIDITSLEASIHFTAETADAFLAEHLAKILINGQVAELDVNFNVVSDGGAGSIVTAIPEPMTLSLLGLGGLLIGRRRRV